MSPIELFTVNSSPKLVSNLNYQKKSSQKKRGFITEDSNVELSLSPSNCGTGRQLHQVYEDADQENLLPLRNSYELEQTYGAHLGQMKQ